MTKPKYREINIVPPMDVDIYAEPTWFIEKRALTDLQEQCDRLEKALEKALDHYSCSYQQIILTGNEIAVEALAEYRKWKNNKGENE